MPVTVIEQPTTSTAGINFFIKQLARLNRGKWNVSPGPYPHNAQIAKPSNFENTYNVTVERLQMPDLPSDWEDREHWQPLLVKRDRPERSKRLLYYWHGGAFVNMIGSFHWKFLGRMVHELDADVVIQTYTMVPYGGIIQDVHKLIAVYQRVYDLAKGKGQELVIGGDSAGGTIAASVLLALNDNQIPLPDQAFMLAPALAMDLQKPENMAIQPFDPMLSIERTVVVLRAWSTGPIDFDAVRKPFGPPTNDEKTKMEHPYAAPINGDWSFLRKAKMPITLIQGTYDILLPQVRQFVQIAKDIDLELTYIEADRACHAYPMVAEIWGSSWFAPDSHEGLRLLIASVLKYSKLQCE